MLAIAERQAATDDGKQVVKERSSREEKYPARLVNDPLYPIAADLGGLYVAKIDGQTTLDHTSDYPQHEPRQTQRRGIDHTKRLIFAILMVILLVIVGSCVGGILGSRKTKATGSQYKHHLFAHYVLC